MQVLTRGQSRPVTWLNATLREQLERVVVNATNDEEAATTRQQVQLELEDEIDHVIARLTAITTLRAGMRDYRSLMKDASTGVKNYTALTRQVLDHVLNQREHELTDLKKLSYSIKGLLKKGFRYCIVTCEVNLTLTHRTASLVSIPSHDRRTTRT